MDPFLHDFRQILGTKKGPNCTQCSAIQKFWRGHSTRQKIALQTNHEFFEEETKRTLHLEAQQTALNRENEIERMILEVENLDFIMKNIELNRISAAKIIQRCWRKYLRNKTKLSD